MSWLTQKELKTFIAAGTVFWLPLVIFFKLANEIIEREPIFFDAALITWIRLHASSFLDSFFVVVTAFGNVEVLLPLALLIIAYLWLKRNRMAVLTVVFGFFGASIATIVLKLLFQRARPDVLHAVITETGYSFPSGHALMTSALAFAVMAISWRTRFRWHAVIGGGLFMVLVGYSRVYLGVHYPSDVIAGWCVSFVWIVLVDMIIRGRLRIPVISAYISRPK